MASLTNSTGNNSSGLDSLFTGPPSDAQAQAGIQLRAFVLNLGVSLALFAFEVIGFFLLKSAAIGRRI